jgi:hypothetical protein
MEAQEPCLIGGAYDPRFAQVPVDFPRPAPVGAVAGVMPKSLLVDYGGKLYAPGCTPPEMFERWDICEDLAQQLSGKAIEAKTGERAYMAEADILAEFLEQLLEKDWGSDAEMRWVVRRIAELLQWPVPSDAAKKDA